MGALDPDGTRAAYTNTGSWVTIYAPGTSVVSALPKFDHAEWPLRKDLANGLPTGPDPNFQASLVGQWSGTSFAAGWVSASIAAQLLEQAAPDGLTDISPEVAGARATSAFEAMEGDLHRWVASHDVPQ